MPLKIQRIPRGMLSLLGIVGQGRNLDEINEELQGVVGLEPYLLAADIESEVAISAAVSAVNSNVSITIPQAQAWRIVCISGGLEQYTVAPASALFGGSMRVATSQPAVHLASTQFTTVAITDGPAWNWTPGSPYVFPGGTTFFNRLQNTLSAGTVVLNLRILFYRLTA